MGQILEAGEQRLVLIIHLLVEHGKGVVPDVGVGDWHGGRHLASVVKVSVLDVLCQPVLDKVQDVLTNGDLGTNNGIHDSQMTVPAMS